MDDLIRILLIFSFILLRLGFSTAGDTIAANQNISDGDGITSAGGSFELGFFSPQNSSNRYLGIWYKKLATGTVVWVANRDIPLTDSSGVVKVTAEGVLTILSLSHSNRTIWYSSNTSRAVQNPIAQLLDSGNLVVRNENDDNPDNFLWQSFDYPCNTLLPGMKLGRNMVTGLDRHLSSWKTTDDPSMGNFIYGIDPSGFPQLIQRNGSAETFRSGPWNGLRFSGFPAQRPNPIYTYSFIFNDKEVFYTYELINSSVVSRLVLNSNGDMQRLTWIDRRQGWIAYSSVPMDDCDSYALCGVQGSCDINGVPKCGCLKGFVPQYPNDWVMADWSGGCIQRTPLNCGKGDGFLKYSGIKLPDTRNSWFNTSINLRECASVCLRNCSCTAYANLDIRGGSGCLLWFGDLIDIRDLAENGQEIYVRMAAAELGRHNSSIMKKARWFLVGALAIIVGSILLGLLLASLCKNKGGRIRYQSTEGQSEDLKLTLFDYATILNATNNFWIGNKIGEGGFGPVYKGVLQGGQDREIAVKRLSQDSRQGLNEFRNEVEYIVKLQHRNLVKLLGYCIHKEEKMLIYEYMPNNSLDSFIFDQSRGAELDWPKRFHIIDGIARGLLYLHQDSRLRIIHRDLKAGNILLDSEMNPKISDFGMARSFRGNQIQANTERLVGTFGYMSPEYAREGIYSLKSDVFSFGVLVLEIVSGKRNRGFSHPDHYLSLLGHAWTLYTEGRYLELMDASMGDSFPPSQVLRSIHVGLLCVQHRVDARPSMSSVVVMLSSDVPLPQPNEPGFFSDSNSSRHHIAFSGTEAITLLEGR